MLKKFLWSGLGLVLALLVAAMLVLIKSSQFQAMAAAGAQMQMPPQKVNVAEVQQSQWRNRLPAVGTVVAMQGAQLRVEAEGRVKTIAFTAGAEVASGAPLLYLDDEVEQAQLKEAQAAAALAQLTEKRARELITSHNISQGELDQARATVQQTQAQVAYIQALIDKKILRAPFAGRLGIRQVSLGQFLDKGSNVVSLQSLDPIYVEFSLPQRYLALLADGLAVTADIDAFGGQQLTGKVSALNPDLDPATRNLRVQATFANPEGQLRPGMYVTVSLAEAQSRTVLLIPITAVQPGAYGDSVFVVEKAGDQLSLRQQPVELGEQRGDFVVVQKGLEAGQQVVSTGVFKLFPGMAVEVDNSLAPHFQLDPKPDNT
ncbi:MAG: efflux RND transporter periplasmic adaptor subunit [Pseudomonadota bacterium]|uniref:efflux RND transporter periplasmic adaptor subunit n=1 Tax=Gallaecimonas pentaromativorans TaxID=584787 RepID=UPI00067E7D0F|nr:efflux RND transporter periplasmic adaptor subunit [Gallaecimonas pentaromativorans]MED5526883.1 efflux RND transporter periplasmic adaptor subunit [Pseudomonadota bacterium]